MQLITRTRPEKHWSEAVSLTLYETAIPPGEGKERERGKEGVINGERERERETSPL